MWDPSTLKTNEIHAVLISWYKVLTATRDTHTHTHTYIYKASYLLRSELRIT